MTARTFACATTSVAEARSFAVAVVSGLGQVPSVDVLELLVSELAANCVRHAQTGFRVEVGPVPDGIRVEVTDQGGGSPQMRDPPPTVASGRGLRIIDALAEEWGIDEGGPGTTRVWFRLPVGAPITP
jgi:anti-sigma regulatory factor (Ser/Thr protein kinase)